MHSLPPFKVKTVEPIRLLNSDQRESALIRAHYNLFKISSEDVAVDLLTDSGTSALSQEQWSRMMLADESYASSRSWRRFKRSVQDFSGKKHVIPVHQGRAAEKIIAESVLKKGSLVFSNGFFDSTRANFEHQGLKCINLFSGRSLDDEPEFSGGIDMKELRKALVEHYKTDKAVLMTVTNNTGGGQPVSRNNIYKAAYSAHKAGALFIVDACRIVENAYFILRNDDGARSNYNLENIIQAIFSFSDVAFMSAKKDGLSNSGGFIVTDDDDLALRMKELVTLYEGHSTYGGMSGRDMESVARGLKEAVSIPYLEHRLGQVAYLHRALKKKGVPLVCPPGGHAVYVDAGELFSHISKEKYPGQALAVALYQEGGVRSCEIGSLMNGSDYASAELVRLAIPRRVYFESHFDYVVEVFNRVIKNKKQYKGFEITWQLPTLRHFECKLKRL
jgi:tyrosine phenol-lyase